MTSDKQRPARAGEGTSAKDARGQGEKAYVDHGIESLVAMDNPDDSQLGADAATPKTNKP